MPDGGATLQKRSHKLLAASLLKSRDGFQTRRYEMAFLFGSFQPDCNPLSYLKGSLRAYTLRGHNYSNSQHYIFFHIRRLQDCSHWTVWQYYTLGKLTHYVADAFTYPHNETYTDTLLSHHQYEVNLRLYLKTYLDTHDLEQIRSCPDAVAEIERLHQSYLTEGPNPQRDIDYILQASAILMAACCPKPMLFRIRAHA